MIRHFVIFLFLLRLFCPDCSGQNTTIHFRNGSWDEIVDQARKEKKQIFLDCYTAWCGPCKKLAREIFTQDSVAEFYNRNFICVKMDMEKEGKELGKKYKVMAYPTLLYIDSGTEQTDHALVGFVSGEKLLQEGRNALDPLRRLGGVEERYRQGERGMEFMGHYLGMLQAVARQEEQDRVLDEYARTLTDEQFASAGFWKILAGQMNAQTSPFAYVYQRFMALYRQFYKIAGEKEVNFRLNVVCQNYMSRYVRWNPSRGMAFDTVGYRALTDYLQQVEYPRAGIWMAQLTTADYMRKQDYRGMFESIRETEKSQVMELSDEVYYLMLYLPCFLKCQEKELLSEVVHWIDSWLANNPEGDIVKNVRTRLKEIAPGDGE